MPWFMKYGKIDGEATRTGFEKWIPIDSVQFGAGRSISTPVGDAARRESSAASVSEVTISKSMDKSSTDLFSESIFNTKGVDCKLSLVRQDAKGSEGPYFQVTMKQAILSSYSLSSGGDRPAESLSINFVEVELAYTPQDSSGALGTDVKRATYNLGTGKGS